MFSIHAIQYKFQNELGGFHSSIMIKKLMTKFGRLGKGPYHKLNQHVRTLPQGYYSNTVFAEDD